jgi:hypothetical protein
VNVFKKNSSLASKLHPTNVLLFALAEILMVVPLAHSSPAFAEMEVADMSMAKMAAPAMIEISSAQIDLAFAKIEKKRKLTVNEQNVRSIAKFGAEIVGVKSYNISKTGNETESIQSLSSEVLSNGITHDIRTNSKWDVPLAAPALKKTTQQRMQLEKALGSDSYVWAWVLFHLGDKKESKLILQKRFANDISQAMAMKNQPMGFGKNPLVEAQFQGQALRPLNDAKENSEMDAQLKKAKVHFSNIPNLNIMT